MCAKLVAISAWLHVLKPSILKFVLMLIDTHCHLDFIQQDSRQVIAQAQANQVQSLIVPSVHRPNFESVLALQHLNAQCHCALGIHPLYVDQANENDLAILQRLLEQNQSIAVGEIGLDFYVNKSNIELQQAFFTAQLKLANTFGLPVILHVRGAIDQVLQALRQYPTVGGIAHAFNGSQQQAEQFIKLGFKLGFGGAMTFDRAKKIRALAKTLPLSSIVLETDSPDMPPAWLEKGVENTPEQLYKIAEVLADLREVDLKQVAQQTTANALEIFPLLAQSDTATFH